MSDDKIKAGYSRAFKRDIFVGEKFNRLTIIDNVGRKLDKHGHTRQLVKCRCDCGNIKILTLYKVIKNNIKSCGCLAKESPRKSAIKRSKPLDVNLINKKFGKLTIIEDAGRIVCNKKGWTANAVKCLCDCGNVKIFLAKNVIKGINKSCGCFNNDMHYNPPSVIGKKFNKLTVIEELPFTRNKKNKRVRWVKCICDCGGSCVVELNGLKYNHTSSCGCIQKEILTKRNKSKIKYKVSDKFGRLEIIEIKENRSKPYKRIAKCRCDCGNLHEVIIGNLVSGNVKSCGCLAFESRFAENPWQCDYNQYNKHCSKSRKLDFNLTLEEYKILCSDNCFYCGAPPSIKMTAGSEKRNGIDRINNSVGYLINNCVTSCFICNKMKLKYSQIEFVNQIIKIYKNLFIEKNLEKFTEPPPKLNVRQPKNPWQTEYSNYNAVAIYRNRQLNFDVDTFKKICLDNCYYCGSLPSKKMKVGSGYRNGIDRIDNNKSYDLDNCVTCCAMCNRMKGTLIQNDFINKVKQIYNYKSSIKETRNERKKS